MRGDGAPRGATSWSPPRPFGVGGCAPLSRYARLAALHRRPLFGPGRAFRQGNDPVRQRKHVRSGSSCPRAEPRRPPGTPACEAEGAGAASFGPVLRPGPPMDISVHQGCSTIKTPLDGAPRRAGHGQCKRAAQGGDKFSQKKFSAAAAPRCDSAAAARSGTCCAST